MNARTMGIMTIAVALAGIGCAPAVLGQAVASPPPHGGAEAWPAKPLRLIVPYLEGANIAGVGFVRGESANLVSFIAPRLATTLGQSVIREYRPGRLGIVGTEAAVRAAPDGYTFLYGDLRSIVLSPALDPRPPYDPIKDLVPVIQLSVHPHCVIANSALGAKSVKELLDLEKAKGGRLTFASGGNGTPSHLFAEMLGTAAGIRMSHMPAQGLGPAVSAVLDARADLVIAPCQAVPRPQVTAGKVIPLAVTGTARTPQYEDVPTLREAGYPVDLDVWNGIFAPAGTPKEILERMASEIKGIVESPEGRKWFLQAGSVVTGTTLDEFLTIIKRDAPRWADVIRASGLALPTPMGDQHPRWQQQMDEARRRAAAGKTTELLGPSGLFVFYNNPRPFCYTYSIPNVTARDWEPGPEPGELRKKDRRALVGVLFLLARDLEGAEGANLVERARTIITRDYEKMLGQSLTSVEWVSFESARPGTWKWKAAPVRQGERHIGFPAKIFVDLSPDAVVQVTVGGTQDDDDLARRVVETLRTTSNPECYWSALETRLKAMLGER